MHGYLAIFLHVCFLEHFLGISPIQNPLQTTPPDHSRYQLSITANGLRIGILLNAIIMACLFKLLNKTRISPVKQGRRGTPGSSETPGPYTVTSLT